MAGIFGGRGVEVGGGGVMLADCRHGDSLAGLQVVAGNIEVGSEPKER